jgi:hypothetical protein
MCRSPCFSAHARVSLPWRRVDTTFLAAIERESVSTSTEQDAHVHVDQPLCEKQRVGEVDRAHTTSMQEALGSACQGKRNTQQGGLMARARWSALMLIVR